MRHYFLSVFLILFFGFSTNVMAEINVSSSLEWMTVETPLIIRGIVTDVKTNKGVFAQQPLWDTQDVTIAVKETLKGAKEQTIIMKWFPSSYLGSAEQWKADGHERLFFLMHGKNDYEGVDFSKDWVLYGAYPYIPIDLTSTNKAPIGDDMALIKDAKHILDTVKDRLQTKIKLPLVPDPNVAVGFIDTPNGSVVLEVHDNSEAYSVLWGGSACYLIVPADEKYKFDALKLIHSNNYYQRITGACILSSYPGDDTVKALKTLLSDTGTNEVTTAEPRTYQQYGVRDTAYKALNRLGVEVTKPVLEK